MKKNIARKKPIHSKNNYGYYFFVAILVLALSLSLVTVARFFDGPKIARNNILGEESSNKEIESKEQTETKEGTEQVEKVEPTEVPEPKEPEELEAEKIHQEVEQKIERGQVESIEVAPGTGNQQTGTLKLEQINGQTIEKQIPASQTPVATLQSVQLGKVSLSVNENGTVRLVNGGVRIETNYPVIIDPKTKTVAIKTENGVTVINMFPSQILPQLTPVDKPTTTQSVRLTNENNQPTYLISGKQTRRFMGIFPVEASIKTSVSAKDGSVFSVDEPWYFRNLGFLYSV